MKKLLLSLLIGFVGIISFCSADVVFYNGNGDYGSYAGRLGSRETLDFGPAGNILQGYSSFCFNVPEDVACTYGNNNFNVAKYYCIFNNNSSSIENFYITCTNGIPLTQYVYYYTILPLPSELFGGICPECPEVNTGEILSGYILESEIDTNYCVENGYCPNECGSGSDMSGDLQYSNIYINSILHPGTQNIFVDIPDYITWDYTTTGDNFNIYVGSGYDVDYINSVIDINSYRPTSTDFTNIFVSGLTLIFPYIFILLLIIFIWKLIKRIFK